MAHESDSLYHRLFSHPAMVEALLREFVPEALANEPDFSNMQRVNPKFHLRWRAHRKRDGDVIWRLPTQEGADSHFYLMIEFQSRSDWWMAVRAQVYQGLLWQQVIDEKALPAGSSLPPLLLLVLYNGARTWRAPVCTHELIRPGEESPLWPWQPEVRYYLVNIAAFTEGDLVQRTGLAALLFRLEQPQTLPQLDGLLSEVIGWFREHEGNDRLQEVFAELVREAFAGLGMQVPISEDMLQMKTRISTLGALWKQQWRTEGLAEGRAEGRAEGLRRGKAEALICLLTQRFGAVPPSLCDRIGKAELATIEGWFERAIVAPDLPSIFNQRH